MIRGIVTYSLNSVFVSVESGVEITAAQLTAGNKRKERRYSIIILLHFSCAPKSFPRKQLNAYFINIQEARSQKGTKNTILFRKWFVLMRVKPEESMQ